MSLHKLAITNTASDWRLERFRSPEDIAKFKADVDKQIGDKGESVSFLLQELRTKWKGVAQNLSDFESLLEALGYQLKQVDARTKKVFKPGAKIETAPTLDTKFAKTSFGLIFFNKRERSLAQALTKKMGFSRMLPDFLNGIVLYANEAVAKRQMQQLLDKRGRFSPKEGHMAVFEIKAGESFNTAFNRAKHDLPIPDLAE